MRRLKYNNKDGYAIAFGRDHAVGVFIQIWKLDPQFANDAIENICDGSNCIYDEDALFNGLKEDQAIAKAAKYGFIIEKSELHNALEK